MSIPTKQEALEALQNIVRDIDPSIEDVATIRRFIEASSGPSLLAKARDYHGDDKVRTRYSPSRERWEVLLHKRSPIDIDPRGRTLGFGDTEELALSMVLKQAPGVPLEREAVDPEGEAHVRSLAEGMTWQGGPMGGA